MEAPSQVSYPSCGIKPILIPLQYRTFDRTYLLKTKRDGNLILTILDISQRCLYKTSLSAEQLRAFNIQPSDKISLRSILETLLQQQLLPPEHFPASSQVTSESCKQTASQAIEYYKPRVVIQPREIEGFICPITLEVFQDPVVDNHGHTFEKSAIEAHRKNSNLCPISRNLITSLVPNFAVKQTLEENQKQEPIPNFSLFKKENPKLACTHLQVAQTYLEEGEYLEALDSYTKAFQYTRDWRHYVELPLLFKRMGQQEKVILSCLYLASYQLQEGSVQEAIQTLESVQQEKVFSRHIDLLLIQLYELSNQPQKALQLAQKTAEALTLEHPEQALALYRHILTQNPKQFELYVPLSQLLKSPQEKAHILLIGACHALEAQNHPIAEKLCQEALKSDEKPLLNHYPQLKLLCQDPYQLAQKLKTLANTYESHQDTQKIVKVYRYLIALDPQSSYYQKIIQLQARLPKPYKALSWALEGLQIFLQKQDYPAAESLAQETLKLLSYYPTWDPIPLYEQLVSLYTVTESPQLPQGALNYLAKAYQKQGNILLAEKLYRQAFERFPTYEQAVELANVLETQRDKIPEAMQTYYEAATLSLLKEDLNQLDQTLSRIFQIDPLLNHLQTAQKVHLLTQKHLCQLKHALTLTQVELAQTKSQHAEEIFQAQNQIHRLEVELQNGRLIQEKQRELEDQVQRLEKEVQPFVKKRRLKEEEIKRKELDELKRRKEEQERIRLVKEKALSEEIARTKKAEREATEFIFQRAFGAAQWNQYFGDVGVELLLPPDIQKILSSPCPFWSGKRVYETHLLTLVPQTVNGNPLTLKSLGELVQTPKQGNKTQYNRFWLEEYANSPAPASHWVLMTRDILKDSRDKYANDQAALVASYAKKAGVSYEVPNALDAAVSIFLEYVRSGIRLYSKPLQHYLPYPHYLNHHDTTYTRCKEQVGDRWAIVGDFFQEGLRINYASSWGGDLASDIGVGCLRKL